MFLRRLSRRRIRRAQNRRCPRASRGRPPRTTAAGRGTERRGATPQQPRPYNQVITANAKTSSGIFKVHGSTTRFITRYQRRTEGLSGQSSSGPLRIRRPGRQSCRALIYTTIKASEGNRHVVADPSSPISKPSKQQTIPPLCAPNVAAFSPNGDPVIDVPAFHNGSSGTFRRARIAAAGSRRV